MKAGIYPIVVNANSSLRERGEGHIFLPDGGTNLRPYVIGIHGGGWQRGDQTSFRFIWEEFSALKLGLVLVSYRLAPDHLFPCAYEDLKRCLSWLVDNGRNFGLDNSR